MSTALSALRFSVLPLSPSCVPNAAISSMSDRRPELFDLETHRTGMSEEKWIRKKKKHCCLFSQNTFSFNHYLPKAFESSGWKAAGTPGSPGLGRPADEGKTKPCWVRNVTMFGELGGFGNSNGDIAWGKNKEQNSEVTIQRTRKS